MRWSGPDFTESGWRRDEYFAFQQVQITLNADLCVAAVYDWRNPK